MRLLIRDCQLLLMLLMMEIFRFPIQLLGLGLLAVIVFVFIREEMEGLLERHLAIIQEIIYLQESRMSPVVFS